MKSLVFLGDSLTEWFDWQSRFPDCRVTNLGIAGEPAIGLLSRLGAICAHIPAPEYVFVMTGINDIAMGDADILIPYRRIVETLQSRWQSSTVVAQSILPANLDWIDTASIGEINGRLRQLAVDRNIAYLDVYRSFVDDSGRLIGSLLLDDGVHMSQEGYAVWSKVVEEFLSKRG